MTQLAVNSTLEEALRHFGFVEVGTKSINGRKYSKCLYHEGLNIFAVRFVWRRYYYEFMSRDKRIEEVINEITHEMWYDIDVIRYFNKLRERLSESRKEINETKKTLIQPR